MNRLNRWIWGASIALVSLGILSFFLNVVLGYDFNIGWPLLMICLGATVCLLAGGYSRQWRRADILFIPGALIVTLGVIFLLNVITGDWNAWAYAWLLVLAGLGVGVMLANRTAHWPRWVTFSGLGLVLGGVTLSLGLGAIAGGLFIQVMAPIALVAGGVSLRWLKLEKLLPGGFAGSSNPTEPAPTVPTVAEPDQSGLIEPLSARELEVLRLIVAGLSNAEIARDLTLAQSTVKTHINNLYGKLGVQTRIAAIQRAKELNLI